MQGRGFDTWSGKIPQLTVCAIATGVHVLCGERSCCNEPAHRKEEPPLATTGESLRAATKTQPCHKQMNVKKEEKINRESRIKQKEGSKEGREEIASREQYTFALKKKKKERNL